MSFCVGNNWSGFLSFLSLDEKKTKSAGNTLSFNCGNPLPLQKSS